MRNAANKDICKSKSSYITDWNSIKWNKLEKYVDKQQKRIYKAEVDNNKRKVRNIQRMLSNSKAVLLLAIHKVTETNKGRKTAGIDGYRAMTDNQKSELADELWNKDILRYKPKPTLRKMIPKKNGKKRALGIPTIKDRVVQEIVRMILEPQFEAKFEVTSYGFRPKRRVYDAVVRIFNNIRRDDWCWVFEGDFKGCFDNLSHDFILNQLKRFPLIKLVKRFLKAGYLDNNVFNVTEKGTPQGGLLSPLLANIALTGLEEYLNITYKEYHYSKKRINECRAQGNFRMVRYADDFVIFAKTKEEIEQVRDILKPYLSERGLELAEDKTKITHTHEGFDFLGFNFRLYKTQNNFKCFIKPSKESIKKAKERIRNIFSECTGHNVDYLIERLNPVIRGIGYFWRISVAKEVFSKIDNFIWNKVYKFLRRLHPNKWWKWIKKRYFPGYIDGEFVGKWTLIGFNDKQCLIKMASIPIRRWNMIKHNYSPYDASKAEYFENRRKYW